MKEWVKELKSDSLQSVEAMSWLDKYNSVEDALSGGFNAVQKVGEPFKLPESLESLERIPGGTALPNFKKQLNKLLGAVEKEDDLKDIDFTEGLADARHQNENLVAELKRFAVGKPKNYVKELVKFINNFNNNMINTDKSQTLEKAKQVKESLSVLYGGDKSVEDNYELVRRMFQNQMGLSADEYEKGGKSFIEDVLMRDAVMSKGFMNLAKSLEEEGSTPLVTPPNAANAAKESPFTSKESPTGKALGWDK